MVMAIAEAVREQTREMTKKKKKKSVYCIWNMDRNIDTYNKDASDRPHSMIRRFPLPGRLSER